jgi:hypothetical protein
MQSLAKKNKNFEGETIVSNLNRFCRGMVIMSEITLRFETYSRKPDHFGAKEI